MFRLEETCFLVYSGQNSWLIETRLSPRQHRNHYDHSCRSQTHADGQDKQKLLRKGHIALPDNTLSRGTIFSKKQEKKVSRNNRCTITPARGLKAPAWTLNFLPRQETKSQLAHIISLIYSAPKPKLLNMAFNLACYLCFWKTRTASFKASIASLLAGLPTSPWGH